MNCPKEIILPQTRSNFIRVAALLACLALGGSQALHVKTGATGDLHHKTYPQGAPDGRH